MNFVIGDVVQTRGGNVGIFAGLNAKGDALLKIAWFGSYIGERRFVHNTAKVNNLTLLDNPSCVGCLYNTYIGYYTEGPYGKDKPIIDFSNVDLSKLGVHCPKVVNDFRKRYAKFFTADGRFDESLTICPDKKK